MKKENIKTALIWALLLLSLVLIIAGCNGKKYYLILPGYSPRSTIITEQEKFENRFTEQFREADSLFNEKYDLPLTR